MSANPFPQNKRRENLMCVALWGLCVTSDPAHMADSSSLGTRGQGMRCSPTHFNFQSWGMRVLSSNSEACDPLQTRSILSHHLSLAVCWARSRQIIGTPDD